MVEVVEIESTDSGEDGSSLNDGSVSGRGSGSHIEHHVFSISDSSSEDNEDEGRPSASEVDEDPIEDDAMLPSLSLHLAEADAASRPLKAQDRDLDVVHIALKYVFGLPGFRGDQHVRALPAHRVLSAPLMSTRLISSRPFAAHAPNRLNQRCRRLFLLLCNGGTFWS
jgi:hypothetical protein